MSNDEKIDLILDKLDVLTADMKEVNEDVSILKERVSVLNEDVSLLKEKVVKLERMDTLILNEVVRVHDIMDKRTDDLYVKTSYLRAVYE